MLDNLLDQTKRKALYALILALGAFLVIFNYVPQLTVDQWVEVVIQAVGVLAIVVAAVKAKRLDYTLLYTAAAGLVAALTVAGVFTEGRQEQSLDLLAQVGVVLAAYQAFVRTNTTVPTGQPLEEYVAESIPVETVAPYEPQHSEDPYGLDQA